MSRLERFTLIAAGVTIVFLAVAISVALGS